jgi:hypothetical protein
MSADASLSQLSFDLQAPQPANTKICQECGGVFSRTHNNKNSFGRQKCCSKICLAKYRRRVSYETSPPKQCVGCGDTFWRKETQTKQGYQSVKYCSQKCYFNHINPAAPLAERFEENFIPEPMSGCYLWIGPQNKQGYGIISVQEDRGYRCRLAHRVSWRLYRGIIQPGLFVCHKCDIPLCVNPAHLFLGTHNDNMADMWSKGRGAKHQAKLAANQVIEIRARHERGEKIRDLSAEYGLHPTTVQDIVNRESWQEL